MAQPQRTTARTNLEYAQERDLASPHTASLTLPASDSEAIAAVRA